MTKTKGSVTLNTNLRPRHVDGAERSGDCGGERASVFFDRDKVA
jgi:hypothetical protein